MTISGTRQGILFFMEQNPLPIFLPRSSASGARREETKETRKENEEATLVNTHLNDFLLNKKEGNGKYEIGSMSCYKIWSFAPH